MAVSEVIAECACASAEGRISFSEVVGRLSAAGVERYHVDFVRGVTDYYLPRAAVEAIAGSVHGAPALEFSAAGVEAAVRSAQSGALKYPAFCAAAMQAGCVGYMVSMAGKRVVYYGRTGETHVEWFPGAR